MKLIYNVFLFVIYFNKLDIYAQIDSLSVNCKPIPISYTKQYDALVPNCYYWGGVDTNQNRMGIWVYYNINNNKIERILSYQNGLFEGNQLLFYDNQLPKCVLTYKNGKLDTTQRVICYLSSGIIAAIYAYSPLGGWYYETYILDKESPYRELRSCYIPYPLGEYRTMEKNIK